MIPLDFFSDRLRHVFQHADIGREQAQIERNVDYQASGQCSMTERARRRRAFESRPETMKGWRPISVTYHPAMVATQPAKVIACEQLEHRSRHPGEIPAIAPMSPETDPTDQQHQDAGPHHDPKRPEQGKDRRMRRWKLVQPLDFAFSVVPKDQAREFRHRQLETVRSCRIIRDREQKQRRAPRCFPDALDRRDLLRLMLERIEPVKITRHHLRGRGQGSENEPGPQHARRAGHQRRLSGSARR